MAPVTPKAVRRLAARVPGAVRANDTYHRRRAKRSIEAKRREDHQKLRELRAARELLLNVGSSDNALAGWVNLDVRTGEHSLYMDATQPWEFRDGCAAAVNSEHFIEHLSVGEARLYLSEALRVLRPGGVMRTSTPDLEGLCRAFLDRDPDALATHRSHGYDAETHGDMVNNYVYMWDHRHIWDFYSLKRVLEDVGFTRVERTEYGRSGHDQLRGIDRHDPGALHHLVLCVDAVRP